MERYFVRDLCRKTFRRSNNMSVCLQLLQSITRNTRTKPKDGSPNIGSVRIRVRHGAT